MDNWEISEKVDRVKPLLEDISPTFCLAKWLYVQIHLPHGLTQSCYHPPAHKIPLEELEQDPSGEYDAVVVAVNHQQYIDLKEEYFNSLLTKKGILVDVKGIYKGKIKEIDYWTL